MLRTGDLTWRDLHVIVKNLPPDSAFGRAMAGFPWSIGDVMLTTAVNLLRVVAWQWGGKGKPPEPIYLPGTEPVNTSNEMWAGKPRPIEEMKELLGW